MINDIILITACLKVDNLFKIANSIKENLHRTNLNVLWAIVIDGYNADNEKVQKIVPKLEELLVSYGINYKFFLSGKPNQKNYGGDMFNEPLTELKRTIFRNKNAFVYILDDDNIIHPFLFDRLNKIAEYNGDSDKIYVLTCVGEYGEVCDAYKDIFMRECVFDGRFIVPYQIGLDPSQALHTLNFIMNWKYTAQNGERMENKMFPPNAVYDVELYYNLVRENRDNFVCYNEIDKDFSYCYSERNSFHNGLRTNEEIDEYIEALENTDLSSSYVVVQTKDKKPKMFPITSDIAKEILKKIK